ncbi:MAG: ABC transporter ATP-binding protein/permease [Lachnospiraceae bacterium]|nr:ABC transporter ATP-binding protein/permease [Lachnospiraceae bacterium]
MINKLAYIFDRKDKIKLFFLFILIVIGSFLELAAVAIFSPFINFLMNPSEVENNGILSRISTQFHLNTYEQFLTFMCIIIIIIYVAKNIFLLFKQWYNIRFSNDVQNRLAVRMLSVYMREPYTFHLNKNIAVLQRSIQNDTLQFSIAMVNMVQLLSEILVCFSLGMMLFVVSRSMAMIVALLLFVCVGLYMKITRRFIKKLGKEFQFYSAKIYQWINQSLSGIKEVKVLSREEFFIESFGKYNKLAVRMNGINKLIQGSSKYLVETVCMVGLFLVIIARIYYSQHDTSTFVAQLAVFAMAAFRLLPAANRINEHFSTMNYASASIDLIYEDLVEIENHDGTAARKQETQTDWNFENSIVIRNISYAYPNTDENVLDDACCEIPKGKTAAFIGSSGAGKTTLADIILGLLPPQRGKVLADGMDIFKNIDLWHKQVGYIPQVIYLADDTIRNNIAFGVNEESIDEASVEAALKKAQLYDFVDNLPEGLDTFVGDRGIRLSGGQRQRIGIARALYHDPEILVLDEATSALDNETEIAVMEAIDSLKGLKTMLIIAHRMTTIKNADIIYEIADGKITKRDKKDIIDIT